MNANYYITLSILVLFLHPILSQDCIFPGKTCRNDASCCGGCCINNICTSTYHSCTDHSDLCLEHDCPPGEECYIFKPSCTGCEAYAECKEINETDK